MMLNINAVAARFSLLQTLGQSGLIAALRPDKYVRMGLAVRREGITATTGLALSAVRCPDRVALIDEKGQLTWSELAQRCDALAAALQSRLGEAPTVIGILCRNHRGFIEALAASGKIGADTLLLNTSFAGPQLAGVLEREGVDVVIYDHEFESVIDQAAENRDVERIVAWTDAGVDHPTVDELITANQGVHPEKPSRDGKIILLTSGTTGTPKGARRRGGGDIGTLKAILDRIPWKAEQATMIAAPMFHAWGFGQLILSATLACTIVTERRFDPEATLAQVAATEATGLAVVPVMLDRIMKLPADVRRRYDTSTLRFVTASGSRMRPDVVTAFMDEFGEVIYNSYNATEAGLIATATPADLRAAPDTAGKAVLGTTIRIIDEDDRNVATGQVGRIYVHNDTMFEGYTGDQTKEYLDGFISSGDLGYLDESGRLFVVGRDDEMIVSGGENVYPLEVEQTLAAHGDVEEAAVVGVDDQDFGQRLVGFVVLKPGARASVDALMAHVKAELSNYKVPRDIHVMSEFPRNSTGKLLKKELLATAEKPPS
jgi:acyl-CoA synthetase (AMP-forming)/AMP-acid ligase II